MTKRWNPENLETYFYVGRDFEAYNAIWLEDFSEKTRWKKGNCFRTREEAEAAAEKVKAGVNGKARTATIKGAWSVDGKAFGCNKRQVAVLVA